MSAMVRASSATSRKSRPSSRTGTASSRISRLEHNRTVFEGEDINATEDRLKRLQAKWKDHKPFKLMMENELIDSKETHSNDNNCEVKINHNANKKDTVTSKTSTVDAEDILSDHDGEPKRSSTYEMIMARRTLLKMVINILF